MKTLAEQYQDPISDACNDYYKRGIDRGFLHGVIVTCGTLAMLAFVIGAFVPGGW